MHGALVLPHVGVEHRQEVEHVHLEMLVERNAPDLCLRHDPVVVQLVSFYFTFKIIILSKTNMVSRRSVFMRYSLEVFLESHFKL